MTGGDLEGGEDQQRNADVRALKKLFYLQDGDDDVPTSEHELGLLRDVPIARFQMVLMPSQQAAFNIFQPQLVHMFETLLATPEPWYYMHAILPGGAENLGTPEYALPGLGTDDDEPGPKATLQGVLMRVVAQKRMPDARIALVCQAQCRAVIVRGTQALPYTRCDVQLLADTEQLRAAAVASRRRLRAADDAPEARVLKRALLVAAVAEDECWRAYEFLPTEITRKFAPAPFAIFDVDAITSSAKRAEEQSATQTLPPSIAELSRTILDEGAVIPPLDSEAHTAIRTALTDAIDATEGVEAALELTLTPDQAVEVDASAGLDEQAELAALEVQLWLELDAFLRALAARSGGGMPAPAQVLSLLPPPPAAGWPDEFLLEDVVAKLREQAASQRAMAMFNPSVADEIEPFVPCSRELYPPRRRAQRLSFAVWVLIAGGDNELLQRALEAPSTADRMRMAMLRLRELRAQLEADSD